MGRRATGPGSRARDRPLRPLPRPLAARGDGAARAGLLSVTVVLGPALSPAPAPTAHLVPLPDRRRLGRGSSPAGLAPLLPGGSAGAGRRWTGLPGRGL